AHGGALPAQPALRAAGQPEPARDDARALGLVARAAPGRRHRGRRRARGHAARQALRPAPPVVRVDVRPGPQPRPARAAAGRGRHGGRSGDRRRARARALVRAARRARAGGRLHVRRPGRRTALDDGGHGRPPVRPDRPGRRGPARRHARGEPPARERGGRRGRPRGVILRDGRAVAEGVGRAEAPGETPGVYRAEAYVPGWSVPWVLTNPVYVFDDETAVRRAQRAAWPAGPPVPAALQTIDAFEGTGASQ